MKTWFILLLLFPLSFTVYAEGYRTFTNKSGQTIKAKIISVDLGTETVTLERNNRKKATVRISLFTEDDQNYIRESVRKEKPTKAATKPAPALLSKDEVKAAAKRYVDAWNDKDIDLLKEQFVFPQDLHIRSFDIYSARLNKVYMGKVEGNSFTVKFSIKTILDGKKTEEWCHMASNGKIKYDGRLNEHPLTEAIASLANITTIDDDVSGVMHLRKEDYQRSYLIRMKKLSIPTFGFAVGNDHSELEESMEQTIEWLLNNAATFDSSEPHVYLSGKPLESAVKNLENIKKRL